MADIQFLWKSFSAQILGYIQRNVPNRDDALDIRQEVFMNVFQQLEKLKEETKIQSWIYQITRNTIADYYRRSYKWQHAAAALQADTPSTDEIAAFETELFCCLAPFLHELQEPYRQALHLTMQGFSQQQVADSAGISLSGAKSRIQRARQMLKERFIACCNYTLGEDGKLHGDPDCPRCHGEHSHA